MGAGDTKEGKRRNRCQRTWQLKPQRELLLRGGLESRGAERRAPNKTGSVRQCPLSWRSDLPNVRGVHHRGPRPYLDIHEACIAQATGLIGRVLLNKVQHKQDKALWKTGRHGFRHRRQASALAAVAVSVVEW